MSKAQIVASVLASFGILMPVTAAAQQAVCPGSWAPIDISMGLTPYLHITLDNRPTTVMIDTGWNISTVDAHINGRSLQGLKARFPGMLPTFGSWDFYPAPLGMKVRLASPSAP